MSLKIFLISAIFVVLTNAADECHDKKCIIPKHYTEIGCKPVKEENQCCPSHFDCGDILNREADKCYLRGKTLIDGQEVPEDANISPCVKSCSCSHYNNDSPARFICAHVDCAEYFQRPGAHCIYQKSQEACCAKNIICDEDEINKLPICYWENKEYRLGEAFYPTSEPCYKCICGEGFDNSTIVGNGHCQEISCDMELNNYNELRKGCIPVYLEKKSCCPITWRCPEETDKIEAAASSNDGSKQTCQFGHLTLKVGDYIASDDSCLECKCLVPPMAHCIRQPDCS